MASDGKRVFNSIHYKGNHSPCLKSFFFNDKNPQTLKGKGILYK